MVALLQWGRSLTFRERQAFRKERVYIFRSLKKAEQFIRHKTRKSWEAVQIYLFHVYVKFLLAILQAE